MINNEANPSNMRIAITVLSGGLAIAASFTFSEFIAAFPLLAARLPYANSTEHADILASSTLITTTANTVVTLALASLYSIGIYTSKELGELKKMQQEQLNAENGELASNNYDKQLQLIQRIVRNGLLMGIVAIPFVAPPLYFSEAMFVTFGQNPVIANYTQRFLRIYTLATLPVVCRSVFEQVMFSFNKQNVAMGLSLLNFGIGLGLAILLGFGYGPFPQLGLQGFAYGFMTHDYLTAISFGLYLAFNSKFKDFHFFLIFDFKRDDWQQISNLLKIGLPTLMTIASTVGSVFVDNTIAGIRGKEVLTAQAFSSLLTFTTVIPYIAMGINSSVLFSNALGQENYQLARRIAIAGALVSALTVLPLCAAVVINPKILELLVSDSSVLSEDIIILARKLLMFFAAAIPLEAASYNMLQVLRGTHDHIIPTMISIVSDWLGVAVSYSTTFYSGLGSMGIGVGYAVGAVLRFTVMGVRWYTRTQPENLAVIAQDHLAKTTLSSESVITKSSDSQYTGQTSCWPSFFSSASAPKTSKCNWTSWCHRKFFAKSQDEQSEKTRLLSSVRTETSRDNKSYLTVM